MRVKDPKDRKNEIITVARELFEKKGVVRTKVSDIVKAVGVAQGLFYYYFSSKDAVIIAVMEQIIHELEVSADRIIQDKKTGFYQKVIRYIDLYFETLGRFLENEENKTFNIYKSLKVYGLEQMVEQKIMVLINQLAQIGSEEKIWCVNYPEEMMLVVISGVRTYFQRFTPDREKLFMFLEQGLHFPSGILAKTT